MFYNKNTILNQNVNLSKLILKQYQLLFWNDFQHLRRDFILLIYLIINFYFYKANYAALMSSKMKYECNETKQKSLKYFI